MITIKLYGKLGERFGRKWDFHVHSPAEALRAIDTLKGGFFDYILELDKDLQGYHVQIDDKTLSADYLPLQHADAEVKITPLLQGADTKGIVTIVAGIAIVAVGIALGPAGWGGLGVLSATMTVQLVGLGIAVSLGGVARLLTSAPPALLATQDKTRSSYIFGGPINTVQQGECVPVAYGDVIIGSAVVSAGMDSDDIA
jgi:predicted phage tail protein